MNSIDLFERAVSLASKEFIRGFIIGQVALLLVLLVLARFLFFRTPSPHQHRILTFKRKGKSGFRSSVPPTTTRGEDPDGAGRRKESCQWVNSLLAQLFFDSLRERLASDERILDRLGEIANSRISVSDILGPMEISKFELGSRQPCIEWIRSLDGQPSGWEAQVSWQEPATLELDVSLLMSWPPQRALASLPCTFSFTIHSLSALIHVQLLSEQPPAADQHQLPAHLQTKQSPQQHGKYLRVSMPPDAFELDVEIHSLIGHRSKLKDVPKLTSLLYGRLRRIIAQYLLHPHGFLTLQVDGYVDALLAMLTRPIMGEKRVE